VVTYLGLEVHHGTNTAKQTERLNSLAKPFYMFLTITNDN